MLLRQAGEFWGFSAHLEASKRTLLFRQQGLSVADTQCPRVLVEYVIIMAVKTPLENVLVIFFLLFD